MRVAFLDEYFVPNSPGGAEWSVYFLARALASKGHAVRILTPDLAAPADIDEVRKIDQDLADAGDIRVLRFPSSGKMGDSRRALASYVFGNPFFHRRFLRELVRRHGDERFDIVHAQGYDSFKPASDFRETQRTPCVATVRDYRALCPVSICLHDEDRAPENCAVHDFRHCIDAYLEQYGVKNNFWGRLKHDLRRRMEWSNSRKAGRALKSMDGAIFVSARILDIYSDSRLAPARSIVIPNLPPAAVPPGDPVALAERLGVSGKRVIAFIGRYSLGKGAKVLAEAMALVGQKRDDVVCLVAGNREYGAGVSNMIFAGLMQPGDLWSLYALAEFVVLPSRWQEPLSRVLLESMRAGVPVIASNTGGNGEIVIDGKTGRLVPRNDPHALAAAILDFLAKDPVERRNMGKAARGLCENPEPESLFTQLTSPIAANTTQSQLLILPAWLICMPAP